MVLYSYCGTISGSPKVGPRLVHLDIESCLGRTAGLKTEINARLVSYR